MVKVSNRTKSACLEFLCRQYSRYLLHPSSKVSVFDAFIFSLCIVKNLSFNTKKYRHIIRENSKMMCLTFLMLNFYNRSFTSCPKELKRLIIPYLLSASLTATAQATVIPTMGLLPAPIRPIIGAYSESVDKWAFQIQVLAMR